MDKAVVYSLLATAFFMYIVISSNTRRDQIGYISSRRLGYKVPTLDFDPLVAHVRRVLEEHGGQPLKIMGDLINMPLDWDEKENASSVLDVAETHDYFNSDGEFNTTLRLLALFPMVDNAPCNGEISYDEMEKWNINQAMDRLKYRTAKEMSSLDRNGDGAISFSEFMPQFTKRDLEERRMETGKAGWWMTQFHNADLDESGTLNFTEFMDFLHPEDSTNENIQKWVISEGIRKIDVDQDMKLNFIEFFSNVYQTYKNQIKYIGGHVMNASGKFAQLDKNKDSFLDVDELKPMIGYISPGEISEAKLYTISLMQQADDDRNGKLSIGEMLFHSNLFFRNLVNEEAEDYNEYPIHDEL